MNIASSISAFIVYHKAFWDCLL